MPVLIKIFTDILSYFQTIHFNQLMLTDGISVKKYYIEANRTQKTSGFMAHLIATKPLRYNYGPSVQTHNNTLQQHKFLTGIYSFIYFLGTELKS